MKFQHLLFHIFTIQTQDVFLTIEHRPEIMGKMIKEKEICM